MNRRGFLQNLAGLTVASAIPGLVPAATGAIEENSEEARARRRRGRFVNVALRTHEDKEVRFYDDLIKDKIVLINMIQAACADGSCPLITSNLVRAQQILGDRIGRDIFMYSISLTPEHDTPEVLRKYAENFRVKPGWHFLTGKPANIEAVRRSLGYVIADRPLEDAIPKRHTGVLRYGIEPLERWGACPALTNPKAIARYISWIEPQGERP